jgi:hypothetical protein
MRTVEKNTVEKKLIENMVELQKVHTDLAEKFDKLSKQLSVLLNLFEMAARSFATHPAIRASEKDKDFLEKVDKLLDQNKVIAKGLTLVEERTRERIYGQQPYSTPMQAPMQTQMPPQERFERIRMPPAQSSKSEEEPKLTSNKDLPKF